MCVRSLQIDLLVCNQPYKLFLFFPSLSPSACMKWRIESDVEDIFRKGEEGLQHGEGFLHQMTSGKAYLHGSDRLGRPVFYVHARMHKSSEQSPKALEDFVLFQVSHFDRFTFPSLTRTSTSYLTINSLYSDGIAALFSAWVYRESDNHLRSNR